MAALILKRLVLTPPVSDVYCCLAVTPHQATLPTSSSDNATDPNNDAPIASLTTDRVSLAAATNTYPFTLTSVSLPDPLPNNPLLNLAITVYHVTEPTPSILAVGSFIFPTTLKSFSASIPLSPPSSSSSDTHSGSVDIVLTNPLDSSPTPTPAVPTVSSPLKNDITYSMREKEKESIISRLMSELDRRTDAIKRLGEDIVKVRQEKNILEGVVRDLKRQESQRELFARQVVGMDVRGLTRDEVVQQYVVVSKNYQVEAVRNKDLQKRVAQLQESLMKKNDAEKKVLEIQQAHTAQQAYIQKLQDQAAKVSKYKSIIVKQEGIIRKLERYQDRPHVIMPVVSPPKPVKQLDDVLPQPTKSQEPIVMYDTALLMRAEAAEARVAALEQELESACREFAIALANADVQ